MKRSVGRTNTPPRPVGGRWAIAWRAWTHHVKLLGLPLLLIATATCAACPAAASAEEPEPRWVRRCRVLRQCAATKRQFIHSRGQQDREAMSPDERMAAKRRTMQDIVQVTSTTNRLLLEELEPHAADARAVESLTWIVNTREPKSAQAAVDLLAEYHLTRPETIELAIRQERSPMRWAEPLLTKLWRRLDADHFRRPRVLCALANQLQFDSQLPAQLAFQTDSELGELELLYGQETIAACRHIDAAEQERQAIELFRELDQKFGSQPAAKGMTFGELATAAIFEMRHLSIGKVAPELEGEDLEGKPLKLRDYRGQVVMLSFWGTWCGPCMARIPQQRELVEKFSEKPFVLLGVNSDPDKQSLRGELDRHDITWRSFWCGPAGAAGELPRRWNVHAWPTVYVLDDRGVVRAKDLTGPALDPLLEKLIAEAARR